MNSESKELKVSDFECHKSVSEKVKGEPDSTMENQDQYIDNNDFSCVSNFSPEKG